MRRGATAKSFVGGAYRTGSFWLGRRLPQEGPGVLLGAFFGMEPRECDAAGRLTSRLLDRAPAANDPRRLLAAPFGDDVVFRLAAVVCCRHSGHLLATLERMLEWAVYVGRVTYRQNEGLHNGGSSRMLRVRLAPKLKKVIGPKASSILQYRRDARLRGYPFLPGEMGPFPLVYSTWQIISRGVQNACI